MRQYEWGHYGDNRVALEQDLAERVREYQRLFHVEVEHIETPGLYKYYSTQRPVDIGTYPKPPHNAPDEIVNYEGRVPVEGGTFQAWGHLTYTRPLTEREMADYELRPSRDNPRLAEKKLSIAEQMKEAQKLTVEQRPSPAPARTPRIGRTDEKTPPSAPSSRHGVRGGTCPDPGAHGRGRYS